VSEKRTVVTVAFPVDDFEDDLLNGCGIDPSRRIYVRISFEGNQNSFLEKVRETSCASCHFLLLVLV